jgi:hypothetical protein
MGLHPVPNIIKQDRLFTPLNDAVTVRVVCNGKEIAFANWDGSNGEVATKHTLTTWYWLTLPPESDIAKTFGLPAALNELDESELRGVRPLFVSVAPQRDTPERWGGRYPSLEPQIVCGDYPVADGGRDGGVCRQLSLVQTCFAAGAHRCHELRYCPSGGIVQ